MNRAVFALTTLLTAALACALPGEEAPNAVATLDEAVRLTVEAATLLPPTVTPAPELTSTPLPPLEFTPLPTDVPLASPPPTVSTLGTLDRPLIPLFARRITMTPNIDGDLSEWGGEYLSVLIAEAVFKPENWTDYSDCSGGGAIAWDDNYLYIAIVVTDDVVTQTQNDEAIFRGDSLEVLLDADLAGDFNDTKLSSDDFQLGLSPGDLTTGDPPPQPYLWFPGERKGIPAGILLAAKPSGDGYTVEAAIPWSVFGITPAVDSRFGFALSISDNDNTAAAEQQSMVSTVATRKLTDPTTWGTLVLGE